MEDLPKSQMPSVQEECKRDVYHSNETRITPDSAKQTALGAREDAGGQKNKDDDGGEFEEKIIKFMRWRDQFGIRRTTTNNTAHRTFQLRESN